MDQQENTGGAPYKRQPKPEEQALVDELSVLAAQYGDQFPHICQFVQKEADRIGKGHKSLEEEHLLDIEGGKPVRLTYKVSVPVEKYPNFNYVGRLLGPKGSTLRGMQEVSGCKMAILGKGSMRDKDKEEQCRLEGGKYSHLNDELHVWIQGYGPPDVAFYKLYVATKEVKKYLHADYNDEIFTEQMMILEQEGGLPKGFIANRGAPRGGRGRGMMRGGMSSRGNMMGAGGPGMSRGGNSRGGGMMRGGMMRGGRGGSRGGGGNMRGSGGRGMHRGGAAGGVSAETLYEDVYEPAPQGYGGTFENGASSSGGAGNSYFEEFPEPGGGGGDGMSFQRQSQGGYGGGNDMMMKHGMGMGGQGSGMGMGGMGMDQGMGMGGMDQGMGMEMGLMGLKRGIMDDMGQPSKFARRY